MKSKISGEDVSATILTYGKWVILGLIVLFIFISVDWGYYKKEITSYMAICDTPVVLGQCNSRAHTSNTYKTTYKIFADKQEVVYWNAEFKEIQKLTKCAIRDRKNWSCKYDDESAEFGFSDGKFWNETKETIAPELAEKEFYISKLRWYLMYWSPVNW